MEQTAFIEFKDVKKTYGCGEGMQIAADGVNFTIDSGEFVVILGQSGAGKSTVLNLLGGMDRPTEGKVFVDGQIISDMNDRQLSAYRAKMVGFIFQFYNLLPSLTALEKMCIRDRDGSTQLIRRAEKPEDYFATFDFCDILKEMKY